MPVPARRVTPALLHIDSIRGHLHGADAIAEVCRFLKADAAHYHWVAVFRVEGTELVLDGQAGEAADVPEREPLGSGRFGSPALAAAAVRPGATGAERPSATVPIRTAGELDGLLTVTGEDAKSLDDSDLRFLQQVAARLAPEMAVPRVRLL